MQIRILHANTIFSYFSDMRLNFYSHNKKIFYPVRTHVNLPSTNHYNSLPVGTISLYFDLADTSLQLLQLCHLYFSVICFNIP